MCGLLERKGWEWWEKAPPLSLQQSSNTANPILLIFTLSTPSPQWPSTKYCDSKIFQMSISISSKVYIILGLLWLPCFQKYILESLFKGLFGSTSYYSSCFQNIYLSYSSILLSDLEVCLHGIQGVPSLTRSWKGQGFKRISSCTYV